MKTLHENRCYPCTLISQPGHGCRIVVTDIFSYVSPGEAKGFEASELIAAIEWISSKN